MGTSVNTNAPNNTAPNRVFSNKSPPAAEHVQHTARALRTCPSCFATCGASSPRIASGLPIRIAGTPAARRPSNTLSTATLLSEQHNTGPSPCASHALVNATAVYVFPVPGGPCTSVKRCASPSATAARCDPFNVRSVPFESRGSSRRSSSRVCVCGFFFSSARAASSSSASNAASGDAYGVTPDGGADANAIASSAWTSSRLLPPP
eukprot:31177-Pelagococcus_subviridis.AAC.2